MWKGEGGGGRGATCPSTSEVGAPASPDPAVWLSSMACPRTHSGTIREVVAGGGGAARGGEGRHLQYLTGGAGGPLRLVPRPPRWLGDLSRPSVPLGHGSRGAGWQWRAVEGRGGAGGVAHLRGDIGRARATPRATTLRAPRLAADLPLPSLRLAQHQRGEDGGWGGWGGGDVPVPCRWRVSRQPICGGERGVPCIFYEQLPSAGS